MAHLRDFNDCLDTYGLSDVRNTGGSCTWNNSSHGVTGITGRLDRLLGNSNWIDQLPNSCYVYLNAATSDHSPMHLVTDIPSRPKPFKYFNYWALCSGYQDVFNEAWNIQV